MGSVSTDSGDLETLHVPWEVERTEPTDVMALLAVQAQSGDRLATERLVRAIGPKVLDVVRAVVGPGHPDLDDLVQEALVAVVRALPAFEGRSSVAHYAARIAVRIAIAGRRRASARRWETESAARRLAVDTTGKRPFSSLLRERRRILVRQLLDELPEPQSEALALRICMGLPMEEVAAITAVPLNTVYSRLRLAKAALRSRIASDPVLRDMLTGEP
jgi:RNA polymerase sigma-70 factor, ECF subfamily